MENLIKTGIIEIDNIWGGFNSGYCYLLITQSEEIGNEILLKYVNKILVDNQPVLYFTSLNSEFFLKQARMIIPDIDTYVKKNLLFLHFINPEFLKINNDKKIILALTSLKKILVKEKASQLIISDFNYFLNFKNLENFYYEIFDFLMVLREYSCVGFFSLTRKIIEEKEKVFSFLKEISAGLIFYEEGKYNLFSRFSHQGRFLAKEEIFISEFPQNLAEQDPYTGLYNYQGFKRILNNLIEKKYSFSLFGYQILTNLDDHLKRIFLHRITKILKEKGVKVPAMRYQDKVYLLFLKDQEKMEECKKIINEEELAGGIRITNFIYSYPLDFQTSEELDRIL